MAEQRYSELKFEGKTYTEQWKIDEILIKNKFNWIVNAEIKNARLEIFENTLVWNAGIWYNGSWYFGVWRDGEWRYGTWQNGVWYNGVWRDGTFKSGIIYKGKFFKGKIESGEIRGGQFIDTQIDPKVVEYTGDEYQVKKEEEQKAVQQATIATAQPTTAEQPVKVHSTPPANQQISTQPKIQQEKLKIIKTFEKFINDQEELIIPKNIEKIMRRTQFANNRDFFLYKMNKSSVKDRKEIWKFIDSNIDQQKNIEKQWINFYQDQQNKNSKYKNK